MRAGQRETPISIISATEVRDPQYGNPELSWSPFRENLWSSAEFRKGREFFENGALISQNSMLFTLDWMDGQGLDEGMRIVCNGTEYNIKSIDRDLDLKRHVKIEAIAGINEVQK